MIGLAFLIGAALLGIGLINRTVLREILSHSERILWGLVTGWMLTTLGIYIFTRLVRGLLFSNLVIDTVVVWVIALLLLWPSLRRLRRDSLARFFWRAENAGLALVLVLFAPIYLNLFWTHMLQPGAEGVYSGGSTWFDLGFHLALTTSFLHGGNFPPVYTPFPPAPLLYPFLPDFQVSILVALGMSLRAALIVTAVPLVLAITGLFYSFARRLALYIENEFSQTTAFSRSNITAALATILFLLNGGLGFIYFYGDWRGSGKSLRDFWSGLNINYANMGSRNIQWTNFIVDTLLPQRGSLFGFAVAVMVFTVFAIVWQGWHSRDATDDKSNGWRLLLAAGVLTGLLPLFHTHIYFGIGLVSGFLFLLRPRRQWLAFWLPALILASPHLIDLLWHVSRNSFMRFQPGWRGHGENFWVWFWLRNIGLPMLLIIPAWFAVPASWRKFYLPFVCLLVFSLLVVVTPNEYDNVKLIYLWYAPTCVLLAAWLVRLAVVQRQRLLASVLALLCIASGLLALQYEAASHNLLYSYEEMAAAAFAQEMPAQALFLTAPSVHQPILSLAGRPVLRGDTAWLWSHGYQFADREADVKSIYAGSSEALQLIDYYGIDFVYLGPRELQAGANQTFFDTHLQAVYHSDKITIYDAPGSVSSVRRPGVVVPRELASRLDHDPYQLLVEFPRISFSAYQLYKAAFGRRPRFAEFMDDMKTLGHELYVGRESWELALENNKNALAQKWVERSDFKAAYADKSNEQYLEVLLNNIGLGEERRNRDALIAALNGGSKSRAQMLREVAEMDNARLEYNDAYILVHYFGYLRRNPDDPPDNNLVGFNFWLNDLNRTGDYRSVSRVFIESGEYKDRSRWREQEAEGRRRF